MRRTNRLRLFTLGVIAIFPTFLKKPLYRLCFGYRIGKRVKIGVSLLDARHCSIADDVSIGHLNLFTRIESLTMGDHVRIGHLNIFRGGDEVNLGRYAEVIRMNEINSIPEPDVVNKTDPTFVLGPGSIVTTGHKIDFTDRIEIGRRVIIGGRNSSLWTHNRQRTLPITIGSFAYVGSEIRMAPGSAIPARSIVGIGSVITSRLEGEGNLIAGVPAKVIKALSTEDEFLIEHRPRPDLPDDV